MPWWLLLFADELVFGVGLWAAKKLGALRFLGWAARKTGVAHVAQTVGGFVAGSGAAALASRVGARGGALLATASRRGGRALRLVSRRGGQVLSRVPHGGARLVGRVMKAIP